MVRVCLALAYYYEDKNFFHLKIRCIGSTFLSNNSLCIFLCINEGFGFFQDCITFILTTNKQTQDNHNEMNEGLVSKEAVALLHWTCNPNVNFSIPLQWPIHGTLPTRLIKVNFCVTLKRC